MAKVRVSYGELHSLGNFSNAKAEASIELEVESRDIAEAFRNLWTRVRQEVKTQLGQTEHERYRLDSGTGNEGEELPY